MKSFAGVALLLFVIVAGWRIGSSLNSDALGMAIGMFFGILAGVPTALLMLMAGRRKESQEHERSGLHRSASRGQAPNHAFQGYAQPPVIIVTGGQPHAGPQSAGQTPMGAQPHYGTENLLPDRSHAPNQGQANPGRKFRVVGESEEWLDEW